MTAECFYLFLACTATVNQPSNQTVCKAAATETHLGSLSSKQFHIYTMGEGTWSYGFVMVVLWMSYGNSEAILWN